MLTEVDLLIKDGSAYNCYEIKSASTFHPDFTKGLRSFEKAFSDLVAKKTVIYSGDDLPAINGISITSYRNIS